MKTKKNLFIFPAALFLFLLVTPSACFAMDGDPCRDQGITVKNLSFTDIWYQSEGGSCTILKRNYSFVIKPGEEIGLFSDMVCERPYGPDRKYQDYKLSDENGNCRVKILPGSILSDI